MRNCFSTWKFGFSILNFIYRFGLKREKEKKGISDHICVFVKQRKLVVLCNNIQRKT